MLFEEVTLTLVGFQLINDADTSEQENEQIKRDFDNKWQSLKSELADNSLKVNQLNDIKVHDTLIKDLIIFDGTKQNIKPEQLDQLTLNGSLYQPQGDIGQTLVLFAKPTTECSDYADLAKKCLKGLGFPLNQESLEQVYLKEGKLFGSPIFEYQGEEGDYPNPFRHLWIWFDIDSMTRVSVQKRYAEIKKLLCYRSKILFSFQQAKNAIKEAERLYLELKKTSESVRQQIEIGKAIDNLTAKYQELDNLKTDLQKVTQISFDLSEEMRYLKYTSNSIKSNSNNYFNELQLIELDRQLQDNFDFLFDFYQRSQNQFLQQIDIDLNYTMPTYDLADQTIAVIRAYIEIEQTKSDQRTENLIQSVGAGIGAGIGIAGIIASSYPLITSTPWAKLSLHNPIHPFISSVLFASVAGAIAGFFVYRITKKIIESHKN